MNRGSFWLVAVLLMLGLSARAADGPRAVTVRAGPHDRHETPVSFTLPSALSEDLASRAWQLRSADGAVMPLQVDGKKAHFVLAELKAGQVARFTLEPAAAGDGAKGVRIEQAGGALNVTADGRAVLSYQGEKTPLPPGYEPQFQRGGYIYPVFTPGGKLLADDYPPDHKHHHGIWSPWTKTEFEGRHPDFWNMGAKTGTVEFVQLGALGGGPVFAHFATEHRMVDLTASPAKVALKEVWDVVVYRGLRSGKPLFVFDMTITQTCASSSPLILPKYHYGGLGFRGSRQWDRGVDSCTFLNSEGQGRKEGDGKPGKWCWVGGQVDGATCGLVIMDHPSNFRFPQPMRLNPKEPFFCYAPSAAGDWKIEPAEPYVARYRFVAADGPADAAAIGRLWEDWAEPPTVEVGP